MKKVKNRNTFKNIFGIYKRDISSIIRNKVALAVIIGLCVVPSLYAWVNIYAAWDPYANTGNVPVAIVNEDDGTVLNGKQINAGKNVVKELKHNDNIDWKFLEKEDAEDGLESGKYYAMIEIPKDFTEGLITLISTDPEKPTIVYKSNEKLNAIANKITSAAETTLTAQIKSTFVGTVNKTSLEILNDLGYNIEENKSEILQIKNTLDEAKGDIERIKGNIDQANVNSTSFEAYLKDLQNNLPLISSSVSSLKEVAESSRIITFSTQNTLNSIVTTLNNDMSNIKTLDGSITDKLNKLKALVSATEIDRDALISIIDEIEKLNNSIISKIDANIKFLEAINNIKPGSTTALIEKLNGVKNSLISNSELENLKDIINSDSGNKETILNNIDKLVQINNAVSNSILDSSNNLYNTVIPAINSTANNLSGTLDKVNALLSNIEGIVPKLDALSTFAIDTSSATKSKTSELSDKIGSFQEELNKLVDKSSVLTEDNINSLLDVMNKNPDVISSILSAPIEVDEEEVYNASIFGVGLAPFYTSIAIWVGILLACAILNIKTEEHFAEEHNVTPMQEHFGKMLLILTIGIIQALIVSLGDVIILGIKPENFMLFIGTALLVAITFTMVIYGLVSVFGNIGKAAAVVIMVFAIAGTGGIYPVETNPHIFAVLKPFWPFTYAINMYREAIAGPYWDGVMNNLKVMGIFIAIFLCLSVLKKPMMVISEGMSEKFEETGL
ncbi:YhgE/Pip domain-containing protein [uncultured Clostridium sp.]|uniref:YhgE/Pip family protein n=1 Tax=uncultured Clostridium sp. TaxID=59620 RepID=UPI0025FDC332|nr:YhgE/Pip domain-containing protein [uncultured Clostridium sp.]